MLTLNFESNQFSDNLPDLSAKIKEMEVLSIVLEHLSDSIKYKESNNNSASVRSYTDAVFTLQSNGYSLESYGMSIQNIDSTNFELESHAAFSEIFKRLLGYFIRILAAVIAAVLTIKIVSGSNSSGGGSKDSNSVESLKLKLPSTYRDYAEYLAAIMNTSSVLNHLGIAGKEICHAFDANITAIFTTMYDIIEEIASNDKPLVEAIVSKLDRATEAFTGEWGRAIITFINVFHGYHPLGTSGKALVVLHPERKLDSKYTRIMSDTDIGKTNPSSIGETNPTIDQVIFITHMHLNDSNSSTVTVDDHRAERFRNAILKDKNNTSINDSLHSVKSTTLELNKKVDELDKLLARKNITIRNSEYTNELVKGVQVFIKSYQSNIIGYTKIAQSLAKIINNY